MSLVGLFLSPARLFVDEDSLLVESQSLFSGGTTASSLQGVSYVCT